MTELHFWQLPVGGGEAAHPAPTRVNAGRGRTKEKEKRLEKRWMFGSEGPPLLVSVQLQNS